MSYSKVITYNFEIAGDVWAITHFSDTCINFEETRKNGQEDTHMSGEAVFLNGRWKLDVGTRKHIEFYESEHVADAIEAHFNKHGTPA